MDNRDKMLASRESITAIAHHRRAASEAFEREDVPDAVTFEQFFTGRMHEAGRAYGGGPVRRLMAKPDRAPRRSPA
jgi:hypothetical protein